MDNRELAAQIAKELTIEFLRKYNIEIPKTLKLYQDFFDTVLERLENTSETVVNIKE